ncbi:hypothetical protein B0H14DRAFT_3502287 [Mycena olivaceomarginata]|nr:hypothetical protein B0H14DRAFT_3502287 [Mycena olivaceomarginata]
MGTSLSLAPLSLHTSETHHRMAPSSEVSPRNYNYKPRNHNYAPVYVAGFGIAPAPPPLPPLSTKILARTGNRGGPHDQLQSPLFGTLFPELRNLIFIYALTEYDDHTRRYSKHSHYYRPGFEYAKSISTNLLLICRRVYLEAKKDELEERVQVARRWTFPLANGACLVHDGAPPVQSVWLATAALAPPGVRRVLRNYRKTFDPAVEAGHDASYPLDLKLHVKRLAFKLESVVVNT